MRIILCECGEFIGNDTFKDYIKTSFGPSTPTMGHTKCGIIFNFIENDMPKRYSSKAELKKLAMKLAEKLKMGDEEIGNYLLEVDRLKSLGTMTDEKILNLAYTKIYYNLRFTH